MSWFEFDCFVCDARLETSDITALVDFMRSHEGCEARP